MAFGVDVKWLIDKFNLSRDYGGVYSQRYGAGRLEPFAVQIMAVSIVKDMGVPFCREECLTTRSFTGSVLVMG